MENKALIVIDMQEKYIGDKSKYNFYPNSLIDKVNERIERAREKKETVIYVKNIGRQNKNPYISEFADNLSIISSFIYEKEKSSIFTNPTLLDTLSKKHISKIEVIGIDGNCCVAASALDASKLGFAVIFPLEYIGIKSKQRFIKTEEKLCRANVKIIGPKND